MKNEAVTATNRPYRKRLFSQFSILNSQFRAWDRGALIILALFLLLLPFSLKRIYASDEVQYYAYLRSVYFDGDLDFRDEYEHFAALGERNNDLAVRNALLRPDAMNPNPSTGKLRNVAPVGSAIMWSPGFVLADVWVRFANALGIPIARDGYSRPYIWSVCLMSALYALGGLLLTYRLARRFAGVFAAALATIAVFLATPLVMYTFILMPWSHAAGFFLFALFLTLWLWDVPNARDHPGTSTRHGELLELRATRPLARWALLGLVGGLMAITREQLGLLLLLPAFESLVAYIALLRARRYGELRRLVLGNSVFLLAFGLALVPQLAAYQILNGRPGPSPTVGGKLIWCSPHLLDTLLDFDPRPDPWCPVANDFTAAFPPFAHGALAWSPILAPALLGLALLWRRDRLLAAALALAFLAQTYINGVLWPTWHLSGAFGFRRLIECTPIFVLGLAALLERLRPHARGWPLLLGALFLVYWNIGLIAQWTFARPTIRQGLIWDGMARAQFVDVPATVIDKLDDLIAHPCRLAKNQNC